MTTSRWGDVVKDCRTIPCGPPDSGLDVNDLAAILDKFGAKLTAPVETRTDLGPATPNRIIDIGDVLLVPDAFTGQGFRCACS